MLPGFRRHSSARTAVGLVLLLTGVFSPLIEAAAVSVFRLPEGAFQPSSAIDPSGTVHLVWLQGDPKGCDVYYVSLPGGRTEGLLPVRVNSQTGSAIALGTIRGAQVAVGGKGQVHVAWNGSATATKTTPSDPTPLLYSRRVSSSAGFEPQRNLIGNTLHLDGGASIAAGRNGSVSLVWHALPGGAPADEAHRQVFAVRSLDDGTSFGPIRAISPTDGVCACCGLKALEDRTGSLLVLYRSLTASDRRPMTLLASTAEGSRWVGQINDPWPTSTCPMSSASLTEGPQGVWAAWETGGQIRSSLLADPSAKPGSDADTAHRPVNVSETGRNRHPSLAVNAQGDGLCAWAADTGWQKGGRVAWRLLDRTGQPVGPIGGQPGLGIWSFPVAFPQASGDFVVAY